MTWEINDSLNWELVRRETKIATLTPDERGYHPIVPISFTVDVPVLQVGVKNPKAKAHWWLGARLSMSLPTLPSSTSEYLATVSAYTKNLRLNTLTLIQLPNYNLWPVLVQLEFPWWHEQVSVEIWKYSANIPAQDISGLGADLERIEKKIDNIDMYR